MDLTIESLRDSGGFTGGPVKREVTWTHNGEEVTATVYVRPMSYHTAVGDVAALRDGVDLAAQRISKCICHADGSPVFQISDITGYDKEGKPVMVKGKDGKMEERGALSVSLANALFELVGDVSGLGKK